MLAAAISDPRQVTLLWLRLCGIIALCFSVVCIIFVYRNAIPKSPTLWIIAGIALAGIMGQLGFVQVAKRGIQRFCALAAYLASVAVAAYIFPVASNYWLTTLLSLASIGALLGLILMDWLLGHAYLTAADMTMRPFRRLNLAVAITLIVRTLLSTVGVYVLNRIHPVKNLWGFQGLLMLTRWFVGLFVALIFIYMAHDCIKRRATQSATGILFVAGTVIFIGELIALLLLQQTGLPF